MNSFSDLKRGDYIGYNILFPRNAGTNPIRVLEIIDINFPNAVRPSVTVQCVFDESKTSFPNYYVLLNSQWDKILTITDLEKLAKEFPEITNLINVKEIKSNIEYLTSEEIP